VDADFIGVIGVDFCSILAVLVVGVAFLVLVGILVGPGLSADDSFLFLERMGIFASTFFSGALASSAGFSLITTPPADTAVVTVAVSAIGSISALEIAIGEVGTQTQDGGACGLDGDCTGLGEIVAASMHDA
jgi:hypothetical protein